MTLIDTAQMTDWRTPMELFGFLAAGFALGLAHFSALWHQARRLASGMSFWPTGAVAIARFALLVGALTLASLHGAPALFAMTIGLLGGRAFVMRRVRRLAE
ncbi:N-ATPase subunit AtpR [Aurantimonas marina]|uniref:N-ATPase subunit AtpR n=1 Tax=Aurantimonas marina TaxID=2780508 RepID=UPI0019D2B221|nr:ATP synthase subunit I [Aurantimonas marina]